MSFNERVGRVHASAFQHIGDPCTVQPAAVGSESIETRCIVDNNFEFVRAGQDSAVAEIRTALSFPIGDYPSPKRGDEVTVGDLVYVLEHTVKKDEYEVKVLVRQ